MKTLFSPAPRRTARNGRPTFSLFALITVLSLFSIQGAETNAKQQLQEGLFEEEVNRDLKSAMKHYQSLLSTYDANRKFAATAVLRLGECYRKLGRTNDAVLQFSRVTREFSEQTNLVTTATSRLQQLGASTDKNSGTPSTDLNHLERIFAEFEKLTAERAEIEVKDDYLKEMTGFETILSMETTLKDPVLSNLFNEIRILLPNHDSLVRQGMSLKEQDLLEEKIKQQLGASKFARLQSLSDQVGIRTEYLKEWVDMREEFLDAKLKTYEKLLPFLGETAPAAGLISTSQANNFAELPEIAGKLAALDEADEASVVALAQTLDDPQLDALVRRWTNLLTLPQRKLAADFKEAELRKQVGDRRYAEAEAISKQMDTRVQALTAQLMIRQRQLQETLQGYPVSTSQASISPEQGEIASLTKLLKSSPDRLNTRYKQSQTALEYAVTNDYLKMVEFLLRRGARIDIQNSQGYNPLDLAVTRGNLELTQLFMDSGAQQDTNSLNRALYWASVKGYPKMTTYLLASGADPNAIIEHNPNDITTVLNGAIFFASHPHILRLLLESGADPNLIDNYGKTPLLHCIESRAANPIPMIRLLVKHGADLDTPIKSLEDKPTTPWTRGTIATARSVEPRQQSLLHILARHATKGHPSMKYLDELLKLGADVNARDSNQAPPLLVAIINQRTDTAAKLLAHGADPTLSGISEKRVISLMGKQIDPLSALLLNDSISTTDINDLAEQLLKRGANPNVELPEQGYGKTPLIRSIYKKRIGIAELLVNHGAKPDGTANTPSKSALNLAVAGGYHNLVRALIKAGADVDRISGGSNFPLLQAVKNSDTNSVSLLLAAGASPNLTASENGWNCLNQVNAQSDDTDPNLKWIRQRLIAAGANPIASHPHAITVVRRNPAAKWPLLLQTNHSQNSFTLAEAIALTFRNSEHDHYFYFPFPDFKKVTVHRLGKNGYQAHRLDVMDILTNTNAQDFRLSWGDVIELPLRPHRVNESWKFDPATRTALARRLQRTITLRYNGASGSFKISPLPTKIPNLDYSIVINSNTVVCTTGRSPVIGIARTLRPKSSTGHSCWLRDTVDNIRDLMTWNDLSRVSVLRKQSGQKEPIRLTADLSEKQQSYRDSAMSSGRSLATSFGKDMGIWLQDGDIIEIPKGDPATLKVQRSQGSRPSYPRPTRPQLNYRRIPTPSQTASTIQKRLEQIVTEGAVSDSEFQKRLQKIIKEQGKVPPPQ